jgi:fumarylpyruvate hydrolase
MTAYVFAPSAQASAAVLDTDERFPVRRIYCVGRNYAAHAREMGGDPTREAPFFFTKPADAVVESGSEIPYPSATGALHHEVELVIAIGGSGEAVSPAQAHDLIWGWAVGVDLTRRDLQNVAKTNRHPWDSSKGFDRSAPLGPITPKSRLARPEGRIRLSVDHDLRQDGRLSDMIWNPYEIVAEASKLWRLAPGDLIFTGTPEGVGPIERCQRVQAEIEGLAPLRFAVM